MKRSCSRWMPIVTSLVAAVTALAQTRAPATCQSDIVSSTVVSSFCSHPQDMNEMIDVVILWRGAPGWFQLGPSGRYGGGGSTVTGPGTKGHVVQHATYGDVTISFDADFNSNTITFGERTISLERVNTIFVDRVHESGAQRITATRWTEPRLPLGGDGNLMLARRSREVRKYLQCRIPMPGPPATRGMPLPQPPVITVCEKLGVK